MRPMRPTLVAVLLVGLFLAGSSVYIVSEFNQAVITQLGEPVGEPITEPGLHFKIPFIQTANMFERTVPGVGRVPQPGPDPGPAVHLGGHLRAVAHHRYRCCSSSVCVTSGGPSRGSTTFSTARRATPLRGTI